jgi:arylformamidase
MTLIDISPRIDASIAVWPGDVPFRRDVALDVAEGEHLTLSSMTTTLHVGAHADAPSHYLRDGQDIAERSLHYFIGPCMVLHVDGAGGRRIMKSDLEGKRIMATRVLLRTGTYPDPRQWNDDFASLSPELVDWLHSLGVITIGIDTPSVDPFDSKALEAHQALARHDMANLEGLVLDGVAEGRYELIALPLPIAGGDGSPVRAILRTFHGEGV